MLLNDLTYRVGVGNSGETQGYPKGKKRINERQ